MIEETQYDVFLSHNSVDKEAVEIIARRLREEANTKATCTNCASRQPSTRRARRRCTCSIRSKPKRRKSAVSRNN